VDPEPEEERILRRRVGKWRSRRIGRRRRDGKLLSFDALFLGVLTCSVAEID